MCKFFFLSVLFFFQFSLLTAQSGCPGCLISIPDTIAMDTIYMTIAPDGVVGSYYDEDVSFRLPKSTTPVAATDSTVLAGLDIDHFEINGLSNLPPGISWEVNQTSFDPTEQTDGCAKFCGVPLEEGLFIVQIELTVKVFIIEQTTYVNLPILILPPSSATEGFSMVNNEGCGELTVSFENNIPSNGMEGFSYLWDFGNGETHPTENPGNYHYSTPGVYEVNYQATIDTVGYVLTKVEIKETSCSDLLSAPDLYIEVFDTVGNLIFQSVDISNTKPPVSIPLNLKLLDGEYTLRVIDNDGGIDGGDDVCNTFSFTKQSNGLIESGEDAVELTIIHPVKTIQSKDTVIVHAEPETPLLYVSSSEACAGEEITLAASYSENIQWLKDGEVMEGVEGQEITVQSSGEYQLSYVSEEGCKVYSELYPVQFYSLPSVPEFSNDGNFLDLIEPNVTDEVSFQWYLDSVLLEGETNPFYCTNTSGLFELVVTDIGTGCHNAYSMEVAYDPDFVDCVVGTEELLNNLQDISLYPNPTRYSATLFLYADAIVDLRIEITDLTGRKLLSTDSAKLIGEYQYSIDLRTHPSGMYFISVIVGETRLVKRLVKYD